MKKSLSSEVYLTVLKKNGERVQVKDFSISTREIFALYGAYYAAGRKPISLNDSSVNYAACKTLYGEYRSFNNFDYAIEQQGGDGRNASQIFIWVYEL